MPLITWKDEYSVAVPSIDKQHKVLIGIINTLHEALGAGKGRIVLGDVINELVAYTRQHFTYEESVLTRTGYPELASHRKAHQQLISRVQELTQRVDAGSSAAIETMSFLRSWLVEHIQHDDRQYSAFLQSHNIK